MLSQWPSLPSADRLSSSCSDCTPSLSVIVRTGLGARPLSLSGSHPQPAAQTLSSQTLPASPFLVGLFCCPSVPQATLMIRVPKSLDRNLICPSSSLPNLTILPQVQTLP